MRIKNTWNKIAIWTYMNAWLLDQQLALMKSSRLYHNRNPVHLLHFKYLTYDYVQHPIILNKNQTNNNLL